MKDFAKSIRVGNGYNGSENLTQSEYEATQKVLKKWEAEKKSAEETVKKYEKMLADNPTASGWKAILEGAKSRIKEADSNIAQLKKELGNRKVGNSSKFDALESIIQEASMYAENAYRRLNSPYSATNIISDLSHCKQACDIAIKRAQEYDKELQSKR